MLQPLQRLLFLFLAASQNVVTLPHIWHGGFGETRPGATFLSKNKHQGFAHAVLSPHV